MDRKVIIFIAAPFIMSGLAVLALMIVKIKPFLSTMDRGLSALSPESVESIIHKQPLTVNFLDSPIEIPRSPKREFPAVPLSRVAPPQQKQDEPVRVTLILMEGDRRMAIVNGIVVKEGDMIQGGTVARIEKDRVLIKGKKEQKWVRID